MKHCFNENDIGRVQLSNYTMNLIHTSDVTFTRNNVQKKKTQNTLDQGNHNEKTLLYVPHYNNVE